MSLVLLVSLKPFFDDSVHYSHILLLEYVAYHRDIDRHDEYVMTLAWKGITTVHHDNLETDCEIVWIELKGLGSTYYIQSIAVTILKKNDKSDGSKSECRPDTQV